MKSTTPLVKILIGGLALVVVTTGLVFYFSWRHKNTETPLATEPSQSQPTDNSLTRTVAGTTWSYRVSSTEAEEKFRLKVVASGGAAELTLSGVGCNSITYSVTTNKSDLYEKERSIAGKVYYLEGAMSTLRGCIGETADYDARVGEELAHIFDSLERN